MIDRLHGAVTLSGVLFQGNFDNRLRAAIGYAPSIYNAGSTSMTRPTSFSLRALPTSLAVTMGILVSFFSSAY
jgi:hypothetical protein